MILLSAWDVLCAYRLRFIKMVYSHSTLSIMLSVVIVNIEGFLFPDLTIIKALTISDLWGGAKTYNFASDELPKLHHWPSIHYVEANLHRISYWRQGLPQNMLREIILDHCKSSLVVVPNTQTAFWLQGYLNPAQIIDLQQRPIPITFSFPRNMDSLCGRDDDEHNPRHCTVCKGEYVLMNTDYRYIV